MSSVKDYKCSNCGAGLEFDPPSQNWKCHYCKSEFTKAQLDSNLNKKSDLDKQKSELDSYTCTSCGAELIADGTTSATFCLYCKNHSIIKTRFSGKFQPKNVIPFRLTKKQAEEIYKKWIKKRIFAPKEFKQKEEIEKITGIYAPFWLFDCSTDGMISGDGTRVSSWTQGDYRYTQTKYYRIIRRGSAQYHKIPVDASKKLDDKFMHMIEPYNYSDLQEFSMEYMAGFMAEKYDVEAPESEAVMRLRVERYLEERLNGTINGYTFYTVNGKQINLSNITQEYSLLPIYLLNNRYKDKDHIFIINGQTGKVVGDTPISRLNQLKFAGVLFMIVWIIAVLGGALFA